jgi:transposase-like protein
MVSESKPPSSLIEAVRYFSDLDFCTKYLAELRWPDGPVCPRCEGREHSYLTTRRVWKCKSCKKQFSVKVGTIFEDSPIGLDKWMVGIWLIANSKNGISSHEVGRALGISQKSAWFVLHRIRLAMRTGSFEMMNGEVEVDETYIGGKARNMHKSQRPKVGRGRSTQNKTPVVGIIERDGKVRALVVDDVKRRTLQSYVRDAVESGATVYTDEMPSYTGLNRDYDHRTVNHAIEYVDGELHTNHIENFWSLLKRGLNGTYVSVRPFHLFRYLDERIFTFNERELTDLERFHKVLSQVTGRRLTWARLTAKA